MVVVCGCLSLDGDVVVNGLGLMCCACVVVALRLRDALLVLCGSCGGVEVVLW